MQRIDQLGPEERDGEKTREGESKLQQHTTQGRPISNKFATNKSTQASKIDVFKVKFSRTHNRSTYSLDEC